MNKVSKFFLLLAFITTGSAQAALIEFKLTGIGGDGLLGSNQVSAAPLNPGSGGLAPGGITLDTTSNVLSINAAWGSANGFTDLSGDAVAAHLHGPATMNQNGGVLIFLGFSTSAIGGGIFIQNIIISDAVESLILSGMTYLNVHTARNPGGEIRGQLVAVDEPQSLVLLVLGVLALVGQRRRSRHFS